MDDIVEAFDDVRRTAAQVASAAKRDDSEGITDAQKASARAMRDLRGFGDTSGS